MTDGGDSSDGGGGARGGASNTPRDRGLAMKDLPVGEKKRGHTSGSPLVRMKKILSEERIEEVGADEEDGDKLTSEETAVSREERKPRGRLKEVSEMSENGNGERVGEQGGEGEEDSGVIRLTPPLGDGEGGGLGEGEGGEEVREGEEGEEEGKRKGITEEEGEGAKEKVVGEGEEGKREEVKLGEEEEERGEEKREGDEEGEDGMTTEDDETDDEELEGEEEEEEEEGDDSISPVKEILINVVSARSVTMHMHAIRHTHTSARSVFTLW